MRAIGLLLILSGFLGIPSFGIIGATKNVLLGAIIHVILALAVFLFSVFKLGSLKKWYTQEIDSSYSINPIFVIMIGMSFILSGAYIINFIEPSTKPNVMSQSAITYFGTIFILLGSGVSIISGVDINRDKQ